MDFKEFLNKNKQIRETVIKIGNNQIKDQGKESFEKIIYLPSININPSEAQTAFQEEDIYIVERYKESSLEKQNGDTKNEKDSPVYDIYIKEGQVKMATIENGVITFTPEYLQMMGKLSPIIYQTLMLQQGKSYEIAEAFLNSNREGKELQINPMQMSEEDIEKALQDKENELGENKLEGQEEEEQQDVEGKNQEPQDEEQAMEELATKTGLSIDDIKSCSSLDPKEKITDQQSFEDITNTRGKYTRIYSVASNSKTKGSSRFAFWGITPDGKVEQLPGLEERDGVDTGKEINSINKDGSVIKEKQTSALFMLRNNEEGFSVTIGQYGIIEIDYIRKDPTQNKYIGVTLNTEHEKPTTREVQEFMNDTRTTDAELTGVIAKTEHQINEHSSETTKLQNIDDNPNNDQAIDIDEEVEMHDGSVTTIRKEAEKFDMSPEDYIKYFEEAKGECSSDKIENVNIKIEEEKNKGKDNNSEKTTEKEEDEDLDRGEQILRRLEEHLY